MPTDWNAQAEDRRAARIATDTARAIYVKKYNAAQAIETAQARELLERNQQIAARFIRSKAFGLTIRQTIRGQGKKFSVTEWPEGQACPLGGETRISPDHTPAFILESHGQDCPTGAPGYKYEISFGVERRVEVITTVCIDMTGGPYLYVHLSSFDGRTHLSTWDNTLVLKYFTSKDSEKLTKWLKKEILLSGIKEPDLQAQKREARIFLPD